MNYRSIATEVRNFLDLKSDTDYVGTDASIRRRINFRSANSWTLFFAILIASIGLNTNSYAAIIGAMLISPLMDPIVGAGYGLGVNDFTLLKRSLRNFLIAFLVSLAASYSYFMLSPLSSAQSELLSRTTPTFYDILIAIFGGATGIVALSRKEKGNAIPGVAIATALMPPLCTMGYGLANLKMNFVLGALYLFVINSVFISITTYLFVRFLHFPRIRVEDPVRQKRINNIVRVGSFLVIVPNIILAWFLMRETSYKIRAAKFIETEFQSPDSFVLEKKISYSLDNSTIRVTTVGDDLSEPEIDFLKKRMKDYGLNPDSLVLKQLSLEDRLTTPPPRLDTPRDQTKILQSRIKKLETMILLEDSDKTLGSDLTNELKAFNSQVEQISARNNEVSVVWKVIDNNQKKQVENFLKHRLKNDDLVITHLKKI